MYKIDLPAKIGDEVWIIRNHAGTLCPHKGKVSEIYFLPDMTPVFAVRHIGRSPWGDRVFHTLDEATRRINQL